MNFNPDLHLTISSEPQKSLLRASRDGFGDGVLEAGKRSDSVVVLTADLSESTRVNAFAQAFPERFFNVGVAEQNMMGVAAGLALSGKIPFVASYAAFSPGRNWDQLRVSVCYSESNVKVIGGHTGLCVGPDGATHQALEDLALTRVLPNLCVIVPCDAHQAQQAALAAASYVGPVYIRTSKEPLPVFTTEKTPFEVGKCQVFLRGSDLTMVVCGSLMAQAIMAVQELHKSGTSVELINVHTLKPLDRKTLLQSFRKTKAVVSIEEHQIINGLGSAISELAAQHFPVPIEMVGVHDTFGESGTTPQLWRKYGLDSRAIIEAVLRVLDRKKVE